MKLLSLVAVFFAVILLVSEGVKWEHKTPIICQFFLRRGHMYLHHVDNRDGEIYEGIAVLVDYDEIVFGQFPINKAKDEKVKIVFQTARGFLESDNYFFIIADKYKVERKGWADGYNKCNMVQFHYSVPVLIKKNVNDPNSEKYVGTYNTARDVLYYTDEKGERVGYKFSCITTR